MKLNTPLFAAGLLLSISSIALSVFGLNLYGAIAACLASIVFYPNLLRGSVTQYGVAIWAYIALGYALQGNAIGTAISGVTAFQLESVFSIPLSLSLWLLYLTVYIRIMLYTKLNRSSAIALEPALIAIAIGLYVVANLMTNHTWVHWVVVSPYALLALHAGVIMTTDRIKMKSNAKKGFAAEIGKQAPDFELTSESGERIRLSQYRGERNVLVFFYRGDWCPFCNMMLRTYAKSSERFREKNVILLAVGPDDPATNRALVENLHLDFHVLSDKNLEVVRQYGIRIDKYNASGNSKKYGEDSPLPASFLVDSAGVLRFTSHPSRVGEFLSPDTIFPVLAQLR